MDILLAWCSKARGLWFNLYKVVLRGGVGSGFNLSLPLIALFFFFFETLVALAEVHWSW